MAYCFDEACCWIVSRLEEGKRPFFGRYHKDGCSASNNANTIDLLMNLGAEVRKID